MITVCILLAAFFGFVIGGLIGLDDKKATEKRFTEIEHSMQSFRKELSLAFDNYEDLVNEINGTLAAMHESRADNE